MVERFRLRSSGKKTHLPAIVVVRGEGDEVRRASELPGVDDEGGESGEKGFVSAAEEREDADGGGR